MSNNIKEERKKALKGNYQTPEMSKFNYDANIHGDCSDMASVTCTNLNQVICAPEGPGPCGRGDVIYM